MVKILLSGCNGKMGQVLSKLAAEKDNLRIVAGYDISSEQAYSYPVYADLSNCSEDIDVALDFSTPAALLPLIDFSVQRKVPLVIATTGHSAEQIKKLEEASREIPVFRSANMSLGINLIMDIIKKAAKVLENSFDIEIIEKHHNQKVDAPSGTALVLAEEINSVLSARREYTYDRHSKHEKRNAGEIGVHSIRGGTIVGEHTVLFAGKDEVVEITHSAVSRSVFGEGALRAALFICGKKPGLYGMKDLIDS